MAAQPIDLEAFAARRRFDAGGWRAGSAERGSIRDARLSSRIRLAMVDQPNRYRPPEFETVAQEMPFGSRFGTSTVRLSHLVKTSLCSRR